MSKIFVFLVFPLFFFSHKSGAQYNILDSTVIITEIRRSLNSTYNYQFEDARNSLEKVKKMAPNHPSSFFLEALIIYWENYPLTLDNRNSERFLSLVEESVTKSEIIIANDPENTEAIFFDLFGRAFYVMHWADNGKPAKVFPHLNRLYRQTLKGFELQEKLNEFSFTTGLYNYYIIAYPEKNKSYKAIALLFHKGDKEYGISQLEYCAENTLFLRVEAKFFLTLIYLNYENDKERASYYASELYREFPNNTYYRGLYALILMLNNKFSLADVLLMRLENAEDDFSIMQGHILRGYYLEKLNRNWEGALMEYKKGLEISLTYGDITSYLNAFTYMGMGRCNYKMKNIHEAGKNFRIARSLTSYDYILNDK